MNYKKEIEALLLSLKKSGWDRAAIEEKLGYSDNYIDQQVSKGGNRKFLQRLQEFSNQVLQKAINDRGKVPAHPDADPYLKPFIESLQEQKRILEVQNDFLRRNFETSLNTIAEGQHVTNSQLKAMMWYQALVASGGDEKKAEEDLVRIGNKAAWYGGVVDEADIDENAGKVRRTAR